MSWLARLGKEGMFIWAWGINGCFSVVGAALVPIVATAFGLAAVLDVSAAAYLLAIPALLAVMLPRRRLRPLWRRRHDPARPPPRRRRPRRHARRPRRRRCPGRRVPRGPRTLRQLALPL